MKRILVVDDSFVARLMVRKVLDTGEYEVSEAADGGEAMRRLEHQRPDLVLLDLLMPGESGEEVLVKIKTEYRDIPVIILSADIQETTRKRCSDAGADFFVSKPPRPETLLPAVKAVLS